MSDTLCNTALIEDVPFSPIEPATDIAFGQPFQLNNNKAQSRIYPSLKDGSNFQVQLGVGEQNPVTVASFNGKDFETKEPRRDMRSLRVEVRDANLQFFRALDEHVKAHLKTHKDAILSSHKGITDADIDKLFVPTVRDTAYGQDVCMDYAETGKNAGQFFKNTPRGPVRAPMLWNDESDDKPLRMDALLTCSFYVVLTKNQNGKKYKKFSVKLWPKKLLHLRAARSGGGGGPASVDPSLPCTVGGLDAPPLVIGELKESQTMPNLFFGDVLDASGRAFSANLSSADPGQHATTMLQAVLWPEYQATSGPAVALELETLDGASGAGSLLRHVDACVLQYVQQNPRAFGLPESTTADDLTDAFAPLVRSNPRGDSARVQVAGGRAPTLMHVSAEEDGFVPCESDDALYVSEEACPRKVRVGALGARFNVVVRKDGAGELESFGAKLSLSVVVLERAAEAPMFGGLSAPTAAPAAEADPAEPPAKRAKGDQ